MVWSPTTPGNLVAWYDATTGVTFDGSNLVSQWNDQSGNGYNLTQSTGSAKPTYQATGWNSSMPTLSMDAGDWMQNTSAGLAGIVDGNATPFSVLAVIRATSNANYKMVAAWDDGSGNQRYSMGCSDTNRSFITDGSNSPKGKVLFDGYNVTVGWTVGGGTAINYVNGIQEPAVTLATNVSGTTRFLFGILPVGAFAFLGLISELIVYSAKLTSTDLANFRSYAQGKWGGLSNPPPPALVSVGSPGETTTTTLLIPYPSNILSGDAIYLQVGSRTGSVLPSSITGWTTRSQDVFVPGAGDRQHNLYYLTGGATGSESGNLSITLNTAPNIALGRMYCYRGASITGIEGSTSGLASSGTYTGPSITTTGVNRTAAFFFVADENVAVSPITGQSGGTWYEPTPEAGTPTGSNFTVGINQAEILSAGTISGGSLSIGSGNDGVYRAFAILPRTGDTPMTISATQVQVASVSKNTGLTKAAVQAQVNKLIREVALGRTASQSQVRFMIRALENRRTVAQVQVPAQIVRALGTTLSRSQVQLPVLAQRALGVTKSAIETQASTRVINVEVSKPRTQTQVPTLQRTVGTTFVVGQNEHPSLRGAVTKTFAAVQVQLPSIGERIFGLVRSVVEAQVPSVRRDIDVTRTRAQAQVPSVSKDVPKTMSATQTQTPFIARNVSKLFVLASVQSLTLVRAIAKTLVVSTSAAPVMTKQQTDNTPMLLQAVQVQIPSLRKDVHKAFATAQLQQPSLRRALFFTIPVVARQIATRAMNVGSIFVEPTRTGSLLGTARTGELRSVERNGSLLDVIRTGSLVSR